MRSIEPGRHKLKPSRSWLPACRLRRHPSLDADPAEYEVLTSMLPDGFPFDMEEPEPEQVTYETTSDESDGFFAKGISSLKGMFQNAGQMLAPR